MKILKRVLGVLAVLIIVTVAAGAYLLYAPKPPLPRGAIETSILDVTGRQRLYHVVAPPGLQPGARLLIAFHPSQSNGAKMRAMFGHVLERVAQRDHAVVVYPDGFEGHFNDCRRAASYSARRLAIDDVGFTRAIVERLVAERGIDPRRVYAMGYSNGGHMALRLALEVPDLVRGVGAVAANLPAPENLDCKVAPTPSRFVAFVNGTRDPINPYEGGLVTLFGFSNRGTVLSATASAQWFAERLGAVATADTTLAPDNRGLRARQQDWRAADAHVRLVTIDGGGHTVPQATSRTARLLGPTYASDAVLESMWDMFAQR